MTANAPPHRKDADEAWELVERTAKRIRHSSDDNTRRVARELEEQVRRRRRREETN